MKVREVHQFGEHRILPTGVWILYSDSKVHVGTLPLHKHFNLWLIKARQVVLT